MRITSFFSIAILITFFIPWVEVGPLSFNGFQIPQSLDKIITFSHFFNDKDYDFFKVSYFIYLIPVTAVINTIQDIASGRPLYFLNEFSFGMMGVTLILVLIRMIGLPTSYFTTGYYLTAILSVSGCISYFFQKPPQKQQTNENNYFQIVNVNTTSKDTNSIPTDKAGLFNQLSQLHSLKEKGVITEDIYEREKNVIFDKINNVNEGSIPIVDSSEEISNVQEPQYDPYYAEFFDDRNWFERNNVAIIIVVLTVVIILAIYHLNA